MNIAQIATTRRTCKAFDPQRKIPDAVMADLRTVLRFAPASVNVQPWHFVVAASDESKAKIAATLAGNYAYNAPKVARCSQAVVFCAKTDLSAAHIDAVLAQEAADGRFTTAQAQAQRRAACHFFTDLHREKGDLPEWLAHQSYIALGQLLLGAAAMGLDACPIEGFDPQVMDATLGLPALGLRSVVGAAVGWRSSEDFNAALPKSRLAQEQVLTWL